MKLGRNIFRVLILFVAIFLAISSASVENLFLFLAVSVVICLITPITVLRFLKTAMFISASVSLWKICCDIFGRGIDYVSYLSLFFCVISSVGLLLALTSKKKMRLVMWGVALVVILQNAIYSTRCWLPAKGSVAYLERGKWGISHSNDESFNIKSQYSYNIIKKCINAKSISSLESLNDYSELWMITPTQPFNVKEIEAIRAWVQGGGHLVVVTDHTDLFGHALVANELLRPYKIIVGKDCVISDDPNGVSYWSMVGWFRGLTGNTIKGVCNPFLLQFGYRERVDYSGRSFFSDNAVTDEDRFGVYCVGAYRRYGSGQVSVFTDSTLFADFAMSSPSAQISLRMLRDGFYQINIPGFFLLLSICFLSLCKKNSFWSVCFYFSLGVLCIKSIYMGIYIINISKLPLCTSIKTIKTMGNWDCVDGVGAKYSTLFAANYASDVPMPEWNCIPLHNGDVIYNGVNFEKNRCERKRIYDMPFEMVITNTMSLTERDFLACLVADSEKDGIWFESGLGIAKEIAYKNFWREKCGLSAIPFELGKISLRRGKYVINGMEGESLLFSISTIGGTDEWVIVGDWMIGKFVNGEILIKKKWQHPARQYGDVVVIPTE